jgi:hypothetical protein
LTGTHRTGLYEKGNRLRLPQYGEWIVPAIAAAQAADPDRASALTFNQR